MILLTDDPKVEHIRNKIKADFFYDAPVLLDNDVQGQRVVDGKVIIGPRAGPESCYTNLVHEMAHLVEIDIDRINQHGWGLRYGKYWEIYGQSGYEPQTDQAVCREARVWALQLNLLQEYGVKIHATEIVSSAVYLSAFCYVKIRKKSNQPENDKRRLEVVARKVRSHRKEFTAGNV